MITICGYKVEAEIGRGGMSVVYAAVHDKLKTRHAVKVLDVLQDNETGKTLAAKFLAEARILATLRHPNIVRVTDAEDLAQDVMVKLIDAFKKRQYKKAKGRFRRYLAAMVSNCAVNALRHRQPERWQSLETVDLESLDDPAHDRVYDQLARQ